MPYKKFISLNEIIISLNEIIISLNEIIISLNEMAISFNEMNFLMGLGNVFSRKRLYLSPKLEVKASS